MVNYLQASTRLFARFRPYLTAGLLALAVSSSDSRLLAGPTWFQWRGPNQDGVSSQTDVVDVIKVSKDGPGWTRDLAGRGTPVFFGDFMYVWGYEGSGPDLQEVLLCLEPKTGKKVWEKRFSDFISDNIYTRYSIGAPAVDPETGRVYLLTTPGLLVCLDSKGNLLWQHSMMDAFGRLTFPNGRTGCPVVDDDLVIARGITTNWGKQGPARDRFYAFDKLSGQLVWSSTPGVPPKDSSFSTPVFDWQNGKRVFYAGTGCGNVVCINARTGEPLWRFQMSAGGVNSTVALHGGDKLVAIHGRENLDSSEIGRMVAIRLGAEPESGEVGPKVLGREHELWRNKLGIFTSSPVIVGDQVYQVTHTGELNCVDARTGKILWTEKLGTSQLHASPAYADGKLYVPMADGLFYVIRPSKKGTEIVSRVQLEGNCLGAPSFWRGNVYVHTTAKLYCFSSGKNTNRESGSKSTLTSAVKPGPAVKLQIVPSEVLLRPGESVGFKMYGIDANGFRVKEMEEARWEKYIPPTAKVKAEMDGAFVDGNTLQAPREAKVSAGAFRATAEGLKGTVRGRVLPDLPFHEDFESFALTENHPSETDVKFAYPPLPWIGARFKWEIREKDGNQVFTKTLDRVLFMRATTFFGHPDMKDYTIQADVMTDGNRRNKGTVGLVNQRYIVALKGNWQQLEVSSNHERIKVAVPFSWRPKEWYTLKAKVDVADDGSGVVRAKAWKKGTEEPEKWLIEVPHRNAHREGSPGIYGFSPQSKVRVYVDNIQVTPNS